MAHAFNPSAEVAEVDGFLCVQNQLGLHNEFWDSLGYIEKDAVSKTKQNEKAQCSVNFSEPQFSL